MATSAVSKSSAGPGRPRPLLGAVSLQRLDIPLSLPHASPALRLLRRLPFLPPCGGNVIAFKKYQLMHGIWGSQWVGFKHFNTLFDDPAFVRVLRNTVSIAVFKMLFTFPAPHHSGAIRQRSPATWPTSALFKTVVYVPPLSLLGPSTAPYSTSCCRLRTASSTTSSPRSAWKKSPSSKNRATSNRSSSSHHCSKRPAGPPSSTSPPSRPSTSPCTKPPSSTAPTAGSSCAT